MGYAEMSDRIATPAKNVQYALLLGIADPTGIGYRYPRRQSVPLSWRVSTYHSTRHVTYTQKTELSQRYHHAPVFKPPKSRKM